MGNVSPLASRESLVGAEVGRARGTTCDSGASVHLDSQILPDASHKRAALIRVGALVVLLAAAAIAGHFLGWFNYGRTLAHIDHLRKTHGFAEFSLLFVLIFGALSSVGFPGLPFLIVAGAMFGTALGTAVSWAGAMLGAVGGYWLARTVGHEKVAKAVKHSDLAQAAVGQARSFSGILRLRLVPVLPLGLVNFAAGLAKAPFTPYLIATAIGGMTMKPCVRCSC